MPNKIKLDDIKIKEESKLEKTLRLTNNELIAKAIRDLIKKDNE